MAVLAADIITLWIVAVLDSYIVALHTKLLINNNLVLKLVNLFREG